MRDAIEGQHQAAIIHTYSRIALTECCCGSTACAIWAQALIQLKESILQLLRLVTDWSVPPGLQGLLARSAWTSACTARLVR